MAKMSCIAVVENNEQRDNLCDCIRILGGRPMEFRDTVQADAPYPSELATNLVKLFEHYWKHEITIIGG